jgi:hypothetical protein
MARERTEAQKEASRLNGAQPHGLVTEEGKAISASNALRHGLVANTILIPGESPEEFQRQTPNELMLVEAMVVAKWRQMRAWGLTAAAHAREIRPTDRLPETADLDMPTRATPCATCINTKAATAANSSATDKNSSPCAPAVSSGKSILRKRTQRLCFLYVFASYVGRPILAAAAFPGGSNPSLWLTAQISRSGHQSAPPVL